MKMAEMQKSEPMVIDAEIMILDKPTQSNVDGSGGNIYPQAVAERIILDVMTGKRKYDIEEVSPVERRLKKKAPFEAWPEHAMAESVGARIDEGRFIMSFKVKSNKYGKLLKDAIDTHGLEKIDFFPVGIGNPDENHMVNDYQLSYVTFEVKK